MLLAKHQCLWLKSALSSRADVCIFSTVSSLPKPGFTVSLRFWFQLNITELGAGMSLCLHEISSTWGCNAICLLLLEFVLLWIQMERVCLCQPSEESFALLRLPFASSLCVCAFRRALAEFSRALWILAMPVITVLDAAGGSRRVDTVSAHCSSLHTQLWSGLLWVFLPPCPEQNLDLTGLQESGWSSSGCGHTCSFWRAGCSQSETSEYIDTVSIFCLSWKNEGEELCPCSHLRLCHFSHEGQAVIALPSAQRCIDRVQMILHLFFFFCMWRRSVLLRSFFRFFVISGAQLLLSLHKGRLGWEGTEVLWLCHPLQTPPRWDLRAPWGLNCGETLSEHFSISLCVLQSTLGIKLWWGRSAASFKAGFSSSQQWEWVDGK